MVSNTRQTNLPSATKVNEDNLALFWNFVFERQRIWYRRFVSKLPREKWTTNEILKKYKFTNVRRDNDRGTIWLYDNIVNKDWGFTGVSKKLNTIWQIFIYRMINRIETFEAVGLPTWHNWSPDDFEQRLRALKATGASVFTSAHITCQSNFKKDRISNAIEMFTKFHNNLLDLRIAIRNAKSFQEVYRILLTQYGVGPFISYQLCLDLVNSGIIKFTKDDWSPIARGCKKGLELIFGKGAKLEQMVILWQSQVKYLDTWVGKGKWKKIFMYERILLSDIENCLCEFSKYWSVSNGVGKQRMLFAPITEAV